MSGRNEYPVYNNYYQGSNRININSYFNSYKETIGESNFHKHFECGKEAFMIAEIGDDLDKEKFQLLEEYCSVDNLTVEGELPRMSKVAYEWSTAPCDPAYLHNSTLRTIEHTKKRNLLKNHQIFLKYRGERPICYELEQQISDQPKLLPEQDILVYVRIYVPFTSRHKQSSGALGKLSLSRVIAIPGFQTLDKLRDLISCMCDHSISCETSELPIRTKTKNAKDVYKSGFFFIEDTFYNDFRDPNNKDNSEVVRKWLEMRNFGTFKTEKMEATRIDSLDLKFGYPWVYQHQGDCEHLISFSDARLVNQTDELSISCYPRVQRVKPQPNRYCMTCGIYSVAWVITNNNRLPHDPCLFCDSCFKSYNYRKGEKVGTFNAYPYPYDSDLFQPQHNDIIEIKRSRLKSKKESSNVDSEKESSNVDSKKESSSVDVDAQPSQRLPQKSVKEEATAMETS